MSQQFLSKYFQSKDASASAQSASGPTKAKQVSKTPETASKGISGTQRGKGNSKGKRKKRDEALMVSSQRPSENETVGPVARGKRKFGGDSRNKEGELNESVCIAGGNGPDGSSTVWDCPKCTFQNLTADRNCEMCGDSTGKTMRVKAAEEINISSSDDGGTSDGSNDSEHPPPLKRVKQHRPSGPSSRLPTAGLSLSGRPRSIKNGSTARDHGQAEYNGRHSPVNDTTGSTKGSSSSMRNDGEAGSSPAAALTARAITLGNLNLEKDVERRRCFQAGISMPEVEKEKDGGAKSGGGDELVPSGGVEMVSGEGPGAGS
ncbi:unnamed protein product, partial [Discosporangium mesarthrocarpum]